MGREGTKQKQQAPPHLQARSSSTLALCTKWGSQDGEILHLLGRQVCGEVTRFTFLTGAGIGAVLHLPTQISCAPVP